MPFHQGRLAAPFMRPCSPAPSRATYSAAMEGFPWHPSNTVARGAGADLSAALIDRLRRDADQFGGVPAEHLIFLGSREERAVPPDVIQALRVGAKALDVRHVGAPHELARPEQVAHASDQLLRLGVRIVPAAAPGDREHDLQL